jgi:Protein of unknown function (DUF2612)
MGVVGTWDSGLAGATWDSGLEWDATTGESLGDISKYVALVTSQHADKPKFMALLALLVQPIADIIALLESMPDAFDLDKAIGVQLDTVGLWVGVTRNVTVPLPNVYFSLDQAGVGLDQGTLQGPFDPKTGLLSLPDDAYKTLLRATIASNHWDGTIPGAYTAWNTLFAGTGFGILIQDANNMSMVYALTGPVPDAVTLALFTGGYLSLKPATVRISNFLTPSVPNAPYFGIGVENMAIAGLDNGTFGNASTGP